MRKRAARRRGRGWRRLRTFAALAALVLSLLGSALFYVWTRHQVMSWGYKISRTAERQNDLKQTNRELRLEAASLRSPGRIENIARNELGLDFPEAGQIQPLN